MQGVIWLEIAERLKVRSALCIHIERATLWLLIASLTSSPCNASLNQLNLVLKKFFFRCPNQAKVVATRDYRVGDNLEGLEGFCAPLISEEEGILRKAGRLFSVIRIRGQMNLLLGVSSYFARKSQPPSRWFVLWTTSAVQGTTMLYLRSIRSMVASKWRWANHLHSGLSDPWKLSPIIWLSQIVKPIAKGEEILVSCGSAGDYVGEDGCLCPGHTKKPTEERHEAR